MKSLPNIDYKKLQPKAQEKPVGKYGNLKNYLKEKGIEIDEATLDKKLRTFFEDMITEVLKNPTQWDRTRNINFMELFKYLGGQDEEEMPEQQPEHEIEQMGKQAGEILPSGKKVLVEKENKHMSGVIVNKDNVGNKYLVKTDDGGLDWYEREKIKEPTRVDE